VLDTHVTEAFEGSRRRLFGIAYRMLGSRSEAEDVVQDTYLRWHEADRDAIENPEAWLVTAATRRAIDRLRSLKTEREAYHGPWLPEPLLAPQPPPPDRGMDVESDLSIAFLVLLERLGPEERAAFLLHEVFERDYREIARILEKSEAACRQLVHRARERVTRDRKRFQVSDAARVSLLRKFAAAVAANDEQALLALLAPDAAWTADGGGRVPASPRPLVGAERIVKLLLGLQRVYGGGASYELLEINGEPGLGFRADGQLLAAMAVESDGARIQAAWVIVNPDKLGTPASPQ
jgi:RNA polymerase sigma-70 factor (ECF subfamily)